MLDLDAIAARAKQAADGHVLAYTALTQDVTKLVAECRRLRAIIETGEALSDEVGEGKVGDYLLRALARSDAGIP